MRSLAALTLLGLTWLALQGALGYQLGREHAGREAERIEKERERHRADSLQAVADTAERWAKRQTWAAGFYLTRALNADHALRLEREKCGAW